MPNTWGEFWVREAVVPPRWQNGFEAFRFLRDRAPANIKIQNMPPPGGAPANTPAQLVAVTFQASGMAAQGAAVAAFINQASGTDSAWFSDKPGPLTEQDYWDMAEMSTGAREKLAVEMLVVSGCDPALIPFFAIRSPHIKRPFKNLFDEEKEPGGTGRGHTLFRHVLEAPDGAMQIDRNIAERAVLNAVAVEGANSNWQKQPMKCPGKAGVYRNRDTAERYIRRALDAEFYPYEKFAVHRQQLARGNAAEIVWPIPLVNGMHPGTNVGVAYEINDKAVAGPGGLQAHQLPKYLGGTNAGPRPLMVREVGENKDEIKWAVSGVAIQPGKDPTAPKPTYSFPWNLFTSPPTQPKGPGDPSTWQLIPGTTVRAPDPPPLPLTHEVMVREIYIRIVPDKQAKGGWYINSSWPQ